MTADGPAEVQRRVSSASQGALLAMADRDGRGRYSPKFALTRPTPGGIASGSDSRRHREAKVRFGHPRNQSPRFDCRAARGCPHLLREAPPGPSVAWSQTASGGQRSPWTGSRASNRSTRRRQPNLFAAEALSTAGRSGLRMPSLNIEVFASHFDAPHVSAYDSCPRRAPGRNSASTSGE